MSNVVKYEEIQTLSLDEIIAFRQFLDMVIASMKMHPNHNSGPCNMEELAEGVGKRYKNRKDDANNDEDAKIDEKCIISMLLLLSPSLTHFSLYRKISFYKKKIVECSMRFVIGVKLYRDTTGLGDGIEVTSFYSCNLKQNEDTKQRLKIDFCEDYHGFDVSPVKIQNEIKFPILLIELDKMIEEKEMCGDDRKEVA